MKDESRLPKGAGSHCRQPHPAPTGFDAARYRTSFISTSTSSGRSVAAQPSADSKL